MNGGAQARLVYMANQIGRNFAALGQDDAVAATADHIGKFWDPRMKAQIVALVDDGALEPIAAAAVAELAAGVEPVAQSRATMFAAVDETGRSDAG